MGGRAHPRSRGENFQSWVANLPAPGSSPLTRGKLLNSGFFAYWRGLIPAHAGKTTASSKELKSCGAHPRSRGENNVGVAGSCQATGSSPLTRGKRVQPYFEAVEVGLIPAHAGKTSARNCCHPRTGAHPRSRGENAASSAVSPAIGGSSPLTRGKPCSRK